MNWAQVSSGIGLLSFLAMAWALSENRRLFPWRMALGALLLQFGIAWAILVTRPGLAVFAFCQDGVTRFIALAQEGSRIVFGTLADPAALEVVWGPGNGFILAISVFSTILFVSTLSAMLYHLGWLQQAVQGMALLMRRILGTSGSESLAAAANVVMGQTEAPLLVQPYLQRMTRSELMAMMTGGMATIAGSVLSAYVGLGIPAGHLLTASVISAPAGLLIAKILIPETSVSETAAGARPHVERSSVNLLDAACTGASDGLRLSLNVLAMLIAFTALLAGANWLLGAAQTLPLDLFTRWGWLAPRETGWDPITLQGILGWMHAPFAWLMGVPAEDCVRVGSVLGERIILNEFVGYLSLTSLRDTLQPRSYTLATYALCGFANFASIAIQIAGIGALAPSRRDDLARLGVKSMIGGLLTCYITACVVGILTP